MGSFYYHYFLSGHDMDFRHGSVGSRMSFVVLLVGTILVTIGSYFLSGHDMDFRRGYAKIQVYIWDLSCYWLAPSWSQ
jgi:hypothetical protein